MHTATRTGGIVFVMGITAWLNNPGCAQEIKEKQQVRETCGGGGKSSDARVEACTHLLYQEIRLSGRRLAGTLTMRGRAWKEKGDFDHALSDFTEAINVDPTFSIAYEERGILLQEKGRWDQAIEDYDHIISVLPKKASIYVKRGICWIAKGENERAARDLEEAIHLDPENANGIGGQAWGMKGRLHFMTGNVDSAIADYVESIRLDPKRVVFYMERGNAWMSKGEVDLALADFDQVTKLDGNVVAAYIGRGNAYRSKGDYDRAIQEYDQAIKLKPDELSAYGDRGIARFYMGDFSKAVEDVARLTQPAATAYPIIWLYLARSRAGDKEAKIELERWSERIEKTDWPYPIIGLLLEEQSLKAVESKAGKPGQRCEVNFYIGEWRLLHGAREAATKALQAAVDTCPKNFVEYQGAVAELKRLQN
jgi:lipoprotein NlpI